MTEILSPTAKAVLIAVQETLPSYMLTDATAGNLAAAAIRVIADQVAPADMPEGPDCCLSMVDEIRAELLTIVNELESPYR